MDDTARATVATPRLSILYQLHVLSRLAHRLVEEALAQEELDGTEFAVYSLLKARGSLTVSEIASSLGAPVPSVSKLIGRIEDRSHVVRVGNPDDGRSTLLSLTAEGRAAHQSSAASFGETLNQVKANLGDNLEDVRWAMARYELAMRTTLEDDPSPFPGGRPDYAISYAGEPLNVEEEAEVRSYIDWLRWKRGEA